jgi:hypothetical protein
MVGTGASSARAQASRINGAKSRSPRSDAGKARSAGNALQHGLRAQKFVVLPDEDAAEFEEFAAALQVELAPQGALQAVLAERVALAAWRMRRAHRIEVELFACHAEPAAGDGSGLAMAMIRDGNGSRAFPMLLRYRGAALAEFWRAPHALKALQAEEAAIAPARAEPGTGPVLAFEPRRGGAQGAAPDAPPPDPPAAPPSGPDQTRGCENPNEPERRGNPGNSRPCAGRAAGLEAAAPCAAPGAGGDGECECCKYGPPPRNGGTGVVACEAGSRPRTS